MPSRWEWAPLPSHSTDCGARIRYWVPCLQSASGALRICTSTCLPADRELRVGQDEHRRLRAAREHLIRPRERVVDDRELARVVGALGGLRFDDFIKSENGQ